MRGLARILQLCFLGWLLGGVAPISAGCSADHDGFVIEEAEQSVTVPLRLCDKEIPELRMFAAYTSPTCEGGRCPPSCSAGSPTCPDGATCDIDAGFCKSTTCETLNDSKCTGQTHCNVDTQQCEWFSCTSDASCACGSYCDVPTGRCRLNCLAGADTGGFGLACNSQETCDGNGRCAPKNGIPLPEQDVVLAADPPEPEMLADEQGAWPIVNVTISLTTTNATVGSVPPSPVRLVPQADLLVSCDATSPLTASECKISGAGWTFTQQGNTYRATRVARMQVAAFSAKPRWTAWLVTDDGAHQLEVSARRRDRQDLPGRYVGTLTLGDGSPSTTISIQATVTDGAIMLHDPQRLIAPTGSMFIFRNGSKSATSFLGSKREPALWKQHVATFRQQALTFDSVLGQLVGQIGVQLSSSPGLDSTWSFTLNRVAPLTTQTPCPPGEAMDATVGACIPGLPWEPAPNDAPLTVTQDKATRWLSAMTPRIADPLLTTDTAASLVERLVCYDQSVASNAGFLPQTSPIAGDLACAGGAHGWWAVGLHSYQDRIASVPALTQSDMVTACLQQLTLDAPATVAADGLTNDSCVSLARFYPALFTAAGGLPYRFQTIAGQSDRRARLLFSRLLQQWAELTGFVARTGGAQRAAADTVSIVDQYTPGSMQPSEIRLLNQSANLSYRSVLDAVDSAWTLVLDQRIWGPLAALPGSAIANPDYRQSPNPLANWTFLAADRNGAQILDAAGGPPLASDGACSFGAGDASNFLGDSLIAQAGCKPHATIAVPDKNLTVALQVRRLFDSLHSHTTLFDSDSLVVMLQTPVGSGQEPYLQVGHRIANGTYEFVTFRETAGTSLANSVVVIRRDAQNHTYTLNVPGDPKLGRTRSYVSPPAVASSALYVNSARPETQASGEVPAANFKHVAIWDGLLSAAEVQAVLDRTTSPKSDAERARPAWPGIALPSSADKTANEAALGLPAAWFEGLIPTVNLVEAYVTDAAMTSHGVCRESKIDDALQAALERAARSLRMAYAIKQLAQQLHARAVAASSAALPWETRFAQAASELDAAMAKTVAALATARGCQNPMGLAPGDAPLYFGTADTSTPENLMQASSAVLQNLVGSAGPPAVGDIGAASVALDDARAAWRAQFTSGVQDQIADNDDARRLNAIRSSLGSELVDLCGVTTDSASGVLERFIDPANPNKLTAANCHVKETSDCAGSETVPFDQVNPACVRGEIGEAEVAVVAAGQRIVRARLAWDAGRATADQWNKRCAELDAALSGKADLLLQLEALAVTEENEALSMQILSIGLSLLYIATQDQFDKIVQPLVDRINANVAQRKSDLRTMVQNASDDQQSQDCWNQASLAAIPLDGAEQDIAVAQADLSTAVARVKSLQGRVAATVIEAKAALDREAGLTRPRLAFHYWADELLELYQRRMARARRTTYLFLRAVEHDLQRNFGLDSAVIDATHPQQLHDIAQTLRDDLLQGMEARKPQRTFRILSLCEEVLQLPQLFGETDCNGPQSQQRFREMLYSPDNAVYEAGSYLGQAIPFRLTPAGLTTLCAERLAEVDAHVVGQFGGGLATLKLQKRETFYSETCRDHIDEIGPIQENTLHSASNLLHDGVASAFSRDREWTRVQIDAAGDGADNDFETRGGPGEHANAGLAGRGLFGDYMLIVPGPALAGMVSAANVRDIKLRFDFVAIEDNGEAATPGLRQLAVAVQDGNGAALPDSTGNAVTATCTSCARGSVATVTATPAAQWFFAGWGGACTGSSPTCDVVMTTGRNVSATFVDLRVGRFVLNGLGGGAGGAADGWAAAGSVAVPPSGATNLPVDQIVPFSSIRYLTAVAAPNSVFTGWSDGPGGNDGSHCAAADRCAIDPALGVANLTAHFTRKPNLTINLDVGAGQDPYGVASAFLCRAPSCSYTMEPSQAVTIVPSVDNVTSTNWQFVGWTGDCVGSGTCALNMTGDHSLTGVFRRIIQVTVAPHGGGTISSPSSSVSCPPSGSSCVLNVQAGQVQLVATPVARISFAGWGGDAASCGEATHCNLVVNSPMTVSAAFCTGCP
jgi:hypothetical protein